MRSASLLVQEQQSVNHDKVVSNLAAPVQTLLRDDRPGQGMSSDGCIFESQPASEGDRSVIRPRSYCALLEVHGRLRGDCTSRIKSTQMSAAMTLFS